MAEHGRFVWFEFMTRDADATAKFFKEVIGYGETSSETDMGPYRMLTLPDSDRPVAGVMPMDSSQFDSSIPPQISGFIGCDDIDASVAKVKELGGDVHVDPTSAGEVGRFAVIRDPQGIWINLWQSNEPMEPVRQGVGAFSWTELTTTDLEAGFEFYSELFGWDVKQDLEMGKGMTYRLFGIEGSDETLGGMMRHSEDMPMPPCWGFYMTVDDIKAALERVKENGGQVINEPMEVPGGDLVAHATSPEGIYFALHMSQTEG